MLRSLPRYYSDAVVLRFCLLEPLHSTHPKDDVASPGYEIAKPFVACPVSRGWPDSLNAGMQGHGGQICARITPGCLCRYFKLRGFSESHLGGRGRLQNGDSDRGHW